MLVVLAVFPPGPGNRGAYLLHRPDGDGAEFIAVSFWDHLESITGVFYLEDDRILIETTVHHYTVTQPARST